ncbi:hypothetical protein D7B24_002285 [Verticillium nonalfalfae]|uniref:NapB n=2 Tax=Verticillium TaxID=1036719 RepID=C9SGI3_VERA1|nr:NapB [Verticillium alfalfae VaMs.102]XP_028491331.1 uncharacterized protein D7B24_002285 [Verticillium nonalfalfae]EEY18133.1 NapB [Verticillium alfalfae VaMs.102]RNJ53173.1 hypothetical protein D7B24_002285 [Verticillium nonalfalfae]
MAEESPISYEQLAAIEREFEDVETEIIRKQYELTRPLYEKRQAIISKIPNFWPLVLEQAPPDIDEYIQPQDSALLLAALKNVSVSRFDIENGAQGDPRSVSIKLEFGDNDFFEDKVVEKKFWYRHSDEFTGLISEPVTLRWKAGKDLTGGLLDLVKKVWDSDATAWKGGKGDSAEAKALRAKMEETGMGGVSFFAWLGYVGRRITEAESKAAFEKETREIQMRLNGEKVDGDEEMEDDEDDEDDDLEIFPGGDDLAQAIAVDLWPEALKYFAQAQEMEAMSDVEFEDDDDEDDE